MSNIEELLNEIGQDLQRVPGEMDKLSVRKTMTRRRTIHRIGVAGRSVVISVAALILMLFVGVNTSKKIALAASEIPVIGKISSMLIIRDDIKEALVNHEDLEKPIESGLLMTIGKAVPGKNTSIELTLDSVLVDDHMLSAIIKIKTDEKAEGFYTIQNPKVVNLDTGAEVEVVPDSTIFEESDKAYLFRFAWDCKCKNLSLDFDLVDEKIDFTDWKVLESYHFEIMDVPETYTRHIPMDQTISFEGHDFHFVEFQISETGTKLIYEFPPEKTFTYGCLDMVIEDEHGNILAEKVRDAISSYIVDGPDEKKYCVDLFSSFYYEDVSKIHIHITGCYCALFDDEILTIDMKKETGSFNGDTFPIKVYYGDRTSNTEFGLSAEYDTYYDWARDAVVYFLVPLQSEMPVFNSQRFINPDRETTYFYDFPKTTIDGQEYIVIQQLSWNVDNWENDECKYYYVHGSDYKTYAFDRVIELDTTSVKDSDT
ncbi:MAG: hypothetical protein IKG93_13385 [Clostridiales bacterium]|nr:hypothetical protein [Clostridiales bacterium]